ncbi:MAG: hypothetical protein U5K72_06165 [Balneolaceae bacterium]|nr:hypothetical protein [Balneolaceae bacterium]
MKDTTPEAEQLQRDIIHSKTDHERAMMGIDMIESARIIVMNSIKIKNPDLTERQIVAELFERYYGQEFSEDEKQVIKKGIIQYQKN